MDLKVVKKIYEKKSYVGKDGKEHQCYSYYLCKGDKWYSIKPTFKEGYLFLDLIAEVVTDSSEK